MLAMMYNPARILLGICLEGYGLFQGSYTFMLVMLIIAR
jgi:hypothetical protein